MKTEGSTVTDAAPGHVLLKMRGCAELKHPGSSQEPIKNVFEVRAGVLLYSTSCSSFPTMFKIVHDIAVAALQGHQDCCPFLYDPPPSTKPVKNGAILFFHEKNSPIRESPSFKWIEDPALS